MTEKEMAELAYQSLTKKHAGRFMYFIGHGPIYDSKSGKSFDIPEWETYEEALAVLEDCGLRGEDIFETRYRGYEWEPEEGVLY